MFLFLLKLNRPRKSGRGVEKSYLLDDSVAFGLPLFYNQRLPDHKPGMITVQKHRNIFLTMLSHRTDMGLSQPRTQSLGFTDIIAQRVRKCKNFIIFQIPNFRILCKYCCTNKNPPLSAGLSILVVLDAQFTN